MKSLNQLSSSSSSSSSPSSFSLSLSLSLPLSLARARALSADWLRNILRPPYCTQRVHVFRVASTVLATCSQRVRNVFATRSLQHLQGIGNTPTASLHKDQKYMYVYMYVCMYVCMYIYSYIHMCVCVCVYVYLYIFCIHTHTHTHTHTYIYAYTYTHTLSLFAQRSSLPYVTIYNKNMCDKTHFAPPAPGSPPPGSPPPSPSRPRLASSLLPKIANPTSSSPIPMHPTRHFYLSLSQPSCQLFSTSLCQPSFFFCLL